MSGYFDGGEAAEYARGKKSNRSGKKEERYKESASMRRATTMWQVGGVNVCKGRGHGFGAACTKGKGL